MELRDRVERLSRSNCIVSKSIHMHKLGLCSYQEALEVAVLALSESEQRLKNNIIDIHNKGFPPVILKVEFREDLNRIYEEVT